MHLRVKSIERSDHMKKTVLSLAAVVLLAVMLPVTAFAHGGHRGGRHGYVSGTPQYALCAVDNCEIYGPHEHDGGWYCNQSGINWDDYGVCTVEGCDILGLHEHNGTWYHCANYPNGGGYCGGPGRNNW